MQRSVSGGLVHLAPGRIGVEIDGDEAVVPDAFLKLGNTGLGIDAGALRQHRRADEMVGKELRDAEAELVADRGPGRAYGEIADVMGHEAGARAEDGQIASALLHEAQLVRLDQLAKLVVADLELRDLGRLGGILDAGDLPVAPRLEGFGSGRVVPVAIDDHGRASFRFMPAPCHSVVLRRQSPPRPERRRRRARPQGPLTCSLRRPRTRLRPESPAAEDRRPRRRVGQ